MSAKSNLKSTPKNTLFNYFGRSQASPSQSQGSQGTSPASGQKAAVKAEKQTPVNRKKLDFRK